ncbi:endonuclease domain-containing protein, partial [Lentzea aerocolonigenes]|uniref:endonuclease domain-containing protein n=1 Tax=Lentzea aerocolonigenes TaxID=68170 RepID=UPI001E3519DB
SKIRMEKAHHQLKIKRHFSTTNCVSYPQKSEGAVQERWCWVSLCLMDEWIDDVIEHDGLILRERALCQGVDPDQIMKALRTGRIRRVQRCVYVRRGTEAAPLALARAAVLSSGVADAVASHQTAARVHAIAVPDGRWPEHITVARNERRIRRRELICHGRALAQGDVELRDDVPVTTAVRSLLDMSAEVPRLNAVWAIDDAVRRGVVSARQIAMSLATRPGGRGDGVIKLRVAESDGQAESILETAGRLALKDAGVELPTAQHEVFAGGELVARLDAAYPERQLGLEFDGAAVHEAPRAVYRDRQRQNRLLQLGWTLLRFTWWDVVHDPAGFVATVRRALERQRSWV